MLSATQILRDVYSTVYPLSSFVNDDLYHILKIVDEYLDNTDGKSKTVKKVEAKEVELTLYSNLGNEMKPLGESSDTDTD